MLFLPAELKVAIDREMVVSTLLISRPTGIRRFLSVRCRRWDYVKIQETSARVIFSSLIANVLNASVLMIC